MLKIPEYEHEKMLTLFSHIDASIQNNSRPYTLRLKDLYDPLNPDKGNFEECARKLIVLLVFFRHGENPKWYQCTRATRIADGSLTTTSA